jgi:hypothetical protein
LIDDGSGSPPEDPTISLSTSSLSPSTNEGSSPSNDSFTVSNSGDGTLNYSISDDASWLSVSPTSGSSTGEADTVTVSYSTAGLSPDNYSATITVSDPNATNNPQTISVSLTVNALPATISLSPGSLSPSCDEGSNAAADSFTVQNTGGSTTLSYSITDNVSWLSCSPTSGTSDGEADTITVIYSTSGLSAGSYNGTITVSDPNATNNPQTITVSLTVNSVGGGATVSEDFNSMPSWDSSFDAGWGGSANWSITSSGQSGNALQIDRSNGGSSSKVKLYSVDTFTDYTISVWIACPSASNYWAECAIKRGNNSGQNFDSDPNSWTMIKKFDAWGLNGNGNTWTKYSATFNSHTENQISVGFKLGSSDGNAPAVRYDTLRVEEQ